MLMAVDRIMLSRPFETGLQTNELREMWHR